MKPLIGENIKKKIEIYFLKSIALKPRGHK